jgi:putative tryptophan/tyrosine transport system substrate-binding protein
MNRRDLMTLIGLAAAWPVAARAQQPQRMQRIAALIGGGSAGDPVSEHHAAAFRSGLVKLGWIEGRNLRLDLRFAGSDLDLVHATASDMIRLDPDVIFAATGAPEREMQRLTQTIPIVFMGPSEVAVRIQNIAHPESNVTGFPVLYPSIAGKWLELLKEVAPRVARVAIIVPGATGASRAGPTYIPSIEKAASVLGVRLVPIQWVNFAELERAVDTFAAEPDGGMIVLPSTQSSSRDNDILIRRLAEKYQLPVIHWDKLYPTEGGLMSYGSDPDDLCLRAASYVDRLLRGEKVSNLPVQLPTKFDLVVNLNAAKAIGLTIPESSLARADEVIEQ